MKKGNLKKEVENLQNFSDIDVTQYPSPEQSSLAQELDLLENIACYYYYIDGKTVIAKLKTGEFVAFRRNPKSKSPFNLNNLLMQNGDSVLLKSVIKIRK
jgi:hypothetical protein